MSLRIQAVIGGLLALAAVHQPAEAAGARVTIWDDRIAAAITEAVPFDADCRHGSDHSRLDHGCARRELNRHREPFVAVTVLDEIALLVGRYQRIVLDEEIARNTRLGFIGKSDNALNGDAEAVVYLKYRW